MSAADDMREAAIAQADSVRRKERDIFQEMWGRYAKCDQCGRRASMDAPGWPCLKCSGGVYVLTGYAPPPEPQ